MHLISLAVQLIYQQSCRIIGRPPNRGKIGEILLCVLLYADDVVLMAESEEELQSLLNQLKLFCDDSQLMLNIKKTKCLIFEKRQCP